VLQAFTRKWRTFIVRGKVNKPPGIGGLWRNRKQRSDMPYWKLAIKKAHIAAMELYTHQCEPSEPKINTCQLLYPLFREKIAIENYRSIHRKVCRLLDGGITADRSIQEGTAI